MRLALPSKGELEAPTLRFLEAAGLGIDRPNERQYTADMPAIPGTTVLFQRAADIPGKVEERSADLGITGFDNVAEGVLDGGDVVVLEEALGYSRCDLVIAVPDAWIDVSAMADLADVAASFREDGRTLRVATKYPRLTRRFLLERGVNYFHLVAATGAMEAAPAMGYADVIADLTSSGTTLRENRLKTIDGGTILHSQACLIANRRSLADPDVRCRAEDILELLEARRRASRYASVTANVRGDDAAAVAWQVSESPETAGLQGPTVATVYDKGGRTTGWFAVTVVVPADRVLQAVRHFRAIGASGVTVSEPRFVFDVTSSAVSRLASLVTP